MVFGIQHISNTLSQSSVIILDHLFDELKHNIPRWHVVSVDKYRLGDYIGCPKLRLAYSHPLLKLTRPIRYLSFGKDGLDNSILTSSGF